MPVSTWTDHEKKVDFSRKGTNETSFPNVPLLIELAKLKTSEYPARLANPGAQTATSRRLVFHRIGSSSCETFDAR